MERLNLTEVEFDDSRFYSPGRKYTTVLWSDVIRVAYGYEAHPIAIVDWNFWGFQTTNSGIMMQVEIGSISTMRFSDEIERRFGNPNIPSMKDWTDSDYNIKTFVIYPKEDFGKSLYKVKKRHWWSWSGQLCFAQT